MALRIVLPSLIAAALLASCGREGPRAPVERHAIDSSAVTVTEAGIVLRLGNGSRVVLRDDTTAGDRFVAYESHGLFESLRAHLIEVSFYEGGAYMLIHDRTGDTTWVAGPPVISPSGDRFAVGSVDLVAEYDPTILQIYRVRAERFRKEFEVEPADWGPSDLRWIAEDTLEFQQNVLGEELEYEQHPARVVRSGSEWVLDLIQL